jgi:hypothetical protein
MLADTPLPHGSGANLAIVGTLSEGFRRIVTAPPLLVGYVRWDARSDHSSFRQTIMFSSLQIALCRKCARTEWPRNAAQPVVDRRSVREATCRKATQGLFKAGFSTS